MKGKKLATPYLNVYNKMIEILGHNGTPGQALGAFNDISRAGLVPSIRSYDLLMNVYYKHKLYDSALQVFEEIKKRGLSPSAYTYSNLISIYASCNKQADVDKILELMKDHSITECEPVLMSLTKLNQVNEAVTMLIWMLDKGTRPSDDFISKFLHRVRWHSDNFLIVNRLTACLAKRGITSPVPMLE